MFATFMLANTLVCLAMLIIFPFRGDSMTDEKFFRRELVNKRTEKFLHILAIFSGDKDAYIFTSFFLPSILATSYNFI